MRPAGPLQFDAKWTTDARDTGYYVKISAGDRAVARCFAGTSCRVPETLSLEADDLMGWKVELLTTKGDKVADGFKVCLEGHAKPKTA